MGLGDRVESRGARETAVTFMDLSELGVADVEEEVRVEELAVPAKQPDEQLHRPDVGDHSQMVEEQAKVSQPGYHLPKIMTLWGHVEKRRLAPTYR